jgi:hypothetical protein
MAVTAIDELRYLVAALPTHLYRDDVPATPVFRDWTAQIPLRHQGVLATAIRGCDGAPKHDPSKCLTALVRRAVLNPADDRETTAGRGFFGFSRDRVVADLPAFLSSLDHYPLHYVLHLMHASEVIAYKHPQHTFREFFYWTYCRMVRAMHLNIETEEALDLRLTCDRVAAGTVESDW